MKRFKILSAMSVALILTIGFAMAKTTSNASATSDTGPNGLTAELCGDAVCLSWTPGSDEFSFQRTMSWEGANIMDRYYGHKRQIGANDAGATIPLSDLDIDPTENAGETVTYSFQIVAVKVTSEGYITRKYGNQATLALPRPVVLPRSDNPTDLTAELCGNAVCLSWTPGGNFLSQQVLAWRGDRIYDRHNGIVHNAGTASQARLSFETLKITQAERPGATVFYSFQVVGINEWVYSTNFSNRASLRIDRPFSVPTSDPSGLSVEYCGDMVCVSWTPGEGNYHYQGVRFWKTDDPDDRRYHGGVAIIPSYTSEYEFTMDQMNRRPRGDDSTVTYTFRVEAILGAVMNKHYVGYSNTVELEVPAP